MLGMLPLAFDLAWTLLIWKPSEKTRFRTDISIRQGFNFDFKKALREI